MSKPPATKRRAKKPAAAESTGATSQALLDFEKPANNGATLTDEQQAAITMRRSSVALSAGAGCGKTFVLTERFLSHLEPGDPDSPPADLHELIAITFTDRAAREMRDRIRARCYQRLQAAPPDQLDYWLRLLRSLDSARISTIHAFCGALLRSHSVEAQLDPQFAILEQTQADTLLAELIDDVLRRQLSDHDERLLTLATQFGLDGVRAMVSELVLRGQPIDFDVWIGKTPAEIVAQWDKHRRAVVVPAALRHVATCAATGDLLAVIRHLGAAGGKLRQACDELTTLIPELPGSKNPAHQLDQIKALARVQGLGGKKAWPDETLYEWFKDAATALRREATWARDLLELDPAGAEIDAAAGLDLLRIVQAVQIAYEARKRELLALDFNDLLTRARLLLTDPAHAELQRRLTGQMQLVLVDECQDTDPVQVDFIKALCGNRRPAGKLFFVGDYKQSIYRFRGADPQVFRRLQQETPREGQLPLTLNFRSQPAILSFVNALFSDEMTGGGDADLKYEALRPHRQQITATPAIEFLWAVVDDMPRRDLGAQDEGRRREAEQIARRIRSMLDSGEPLVGDDKKNGSWIARPARQLDIALLFRTLRDVQYYEEALRRHGIDYYLVGGHAFYAQQEVYDVLNLLRILASPADEISMVGVLRSPMFGLTDETLFWLAQHRDGLAAGLFAETLPPEFSHTQRQQAHFAADTLRALRESKDRLPIAGLLNEALRRTGYDAVLLGEFLGERKLANLRKLLDQARGFDESGALTLSDFIVQLSQFVVREPREPLAATHPEGTDVVRLMTIHQAKGLEFPIVFVPDVDRVPRANEGLAAWHDELGPLLKVPRQKGETPRCSGLDLYRAIYDIEDEAERARLLYVATTRAADYLVLSSAIFDFDRPYGPWAKLLRKRFDLRTGRCLAKLPAGAEPAVRVTDKPPACDGQQRDAAGKHDLQSELARAISLAESVNGEPDRLVVKLPLQLNARRRYSVSRLSGQLHLIEEAPAIAWDAEESPTFIAVPADLGTLVHQVLARIDFSGKRLSAAELRVLIERWLEVRGGEAHDHLQSCQDMVSRFLSSPRAAELAAARTVHREVEFLLAWPPDAKKNAQQPDGVYLQGYLDCLYQDATGAWHLLDYKTNRAPANAVAAAAAPYAMQLGVYALAVEQYLGEPAAELVVHFLRPSVEHRFAWDDAARRRTIEHVHQAIQQCHR